MDDLAQLHCPFSPDRTPNSTLIYFQAKQSGTLI